MNLDSALALQVRREALRSQDPPHDLCCRCDAEKPEAEFRPSQWQRPRSKTCSKCLSQAAAKERARRKARRKQKPKRKPKQKPRPETRAERLADLRRWLRKINATENVAN